MCLTAEALALFLNLLTPQMIDSSPGRFVIHATERSAHWVAVEDRWCTMAPQIDRMDRFAALHLD
ncbi:hypothetical protein [Mameliella sediminis]|uniref:hypothetical protein n=1 Tax=Mameliella sediminis TaxID=2836866 RepID=UPI001C447066|nr:hypothetical protein [Mameliella sediminis]MBY6116865.1 hypothetical protein [Antarctobacter heliothermus]MBY6146618.1 hypothetical protein [Mameliella alba]MBV7396531.1 hypothetical protein [Mameliella sediminis]MBY6162847.1 hypothetical protein [Mameliella alba]MBY6171111.1 hypothetical protein [Mameliella alba]